MAMTMKIDIVARETIKPSSPTPQHLKYFKLSLLDQTAPAMYTPLLLFYSRNHHSHLHDLNQQIAQTSQHLKTSLSKMLRKLYPLAGTIKDQTTIECNDDGAEYLEARVSCLLSDIIQQPDALLLRNFLPVEFESTEADTGRLLFVQANFFGCGGMVIGLCISHKIADATTLSTITTSWADTALSGSNDGVKFSKFTAASVFPPLDSWIPPMKLIRDKFVTMTRYVFEPSKIALLKAKSASATVQQPTRVEAVTALIWKCMIHVSRSIKGFPKLSLMSHAVNLRRRTEPPLPESCIGNIVGMFFASHSTEKEIDLKGLVCKLRKELRAFEKSALEKINVEKKTWLKMSGIENLEERGDIEYCTWTSWCRFPLYEADFGWGKPIWATLPYIMLKNVVVLMDTRDGEGIEALVTMSKEDLAVFEGQGELLEFAVVNPSLLN